MRQLMLFGTKSTASQAERDELGLKRSGFTVVELLVVIAVILIAATVLFVPGRGGDSAALSSSMRISASVANGARAQAILKNARARLIIHNDLDANVEKYRRFIGIVYESDSGSGNWIAGSQGTYLPKGVYFDPAASRDSGSSTFDGPTMRLEYPRAVAKSEGSGEEFYYYEFNSNGTMAANFINAWYAVRVGSFTRSPSGALELVFNPEVESLIAGLIFRRVGSVTLVNEPEAFTSP